MRPPPPPPFTLVEPTPQSNAILRRIYVTAFCVMIRREIRPQYVTDTFQEMYDRVDARLTADSFLANRLQAHFIQCHNPVHRGGMIPR